MHQHLRQPRLCLFRTTAGNRMGSSSRRSPCAARRCSSAAASPESLTMAQILQALREERQASNASIQQLTQVLVDNPPRNGNGGGRSTLSEFMRTTPPIFMESTEPLDVDEWIRTKTSLRWSSAPMIMRRSFMLLTVSEAPPGHGGMDSRSCG